jgi:prophage regulatory protein
MKNISSINNIENRLLRLPEVLKIFPVSKSTWWHGVKTGKYPKSIKIGIRTTAWLADDIYQLIKSFSENKSQSEVQK